MTVLQRFWRKVDKFHPSPEECWNWTGSHDSKGRARFLYKGRNCAAARVMWIERNGSIPRGLCVCHRCDNPLCVRPDHLFLGTVSENNRDCVVKGRHYQARKTHCPRNHAYYYRSNGKRQCRECDLSAKRERYGRLKLVA